MQAKLMSCIPHFRSLFSDTRVTTSHNRDLASQIGDLVDREFWLGRKHVSEHARHLGGL